MPYQYPARKVVAYGVLAGIPCTGQNPVKALEASRGGHLWDEGGAEKKPEATLLLYQRIAWVLPGTLLLTVRVFFPQQEYSNDNVGDSPGRKEPATRARAATPTAGTGCGGQMDVICQRRRLCETIRRAGRVMAKVYIYMSGRKRLLERVFLRSDSVGKKTVM